MEQPASPFLSQPFTRADNRPYQPGSIFLGLSETGREVGLKTERHTMTVAGSGTGKGATLIIPNLRRWPHSALVIDPKGENAEQSWREREAMGQTVHVLDPFHASDVPDRLRKSFNPLDLIDPAAISYREDIRVIADGLVMRYRAQDGMWDNGAVSVLAGIIAHAVAAAPPGQATLATVRQILTEPDEDRAKIFEAMGKSADPVARSAGSIGLSKSRKNQEYVSGAADNTEWLDSAPIAALLSASSPDFDLADLKNGKTTVFLVLPPDYLSDHARFLRLFVRCALSVMARSREGGKCLFMLDEFAALGRIDEIAKNALGLGRGYGVQLWPFLQDLGQLQNLYGEAGLQAFFSNSDAHIFFGVTDDQTLETISRRTAMQGGRGLHPSQVRALVGKDPETDIVAPHMIVFGPKAEIYKITPAPFFIAPAAAPAPLPTLPKNEPTLTEPDSLGGRIKREMTDKAIREGRGFHLGLWAMIGAGAAAPLLIGGLPWYAVPIGAAIGFSIFMGTGN
jgi:type IV secretory pathway TraG/TraD family ATPase VirD4